jgi:hypothetical protein
VRVTYFDVSPPLRDVLASQTRPSVSSTPRSDLGEASSEGAAQTVDGAIDPGNRTQAIPATIRNFDAFGTTLGIIPPSPAMDVGPNHVVVSANVRTAIFDKSGAVVAGPFNTNAIWTGFGGTCETTNNGSPSVIYDQLADRWFIAQLGNDVAPYSLCIALSTTGDPTGTYYRWSLDFGTNYPDFPTFALWSDAYLLATREFSDATGFVGSGACALNRAQMLAGNPTPQIIRWLVPPDGQVPYVGDGLVPADLDGSTPPPAGSPAYFFGTMDQGAQYGATQDAITVWEFQPNFANPPASTMTRTATIPTSAFDSIYNCPGGPRRCIPQPGATTSQYLDILSSRQRWVPRVTYRNFGTHETVLLNQSTEAATLPSIAGLRWYELRDPGGAPAIHQQGVYAPGTSDGIQRWNGSMAMDQAGNVGAGYSGSSGAVFPSVYYSGRLASDPLGTFPQGEGVIVNGGGIQTSTLNRWGSSSVLAVDPSDDCTFWHVNQYYPVTSSTGWMLRVASFKFPNCGAAVGVDDPSVAAATRLLPIGLSAGPVPIRFWIAGDAWREVRVDVHDVSGRLVKRLVSESLDGGAYARAWDRTSEAGTRVRPGVYFVRLRAGVVTDTAPTVLVE